MATEIQQSPTESSPFDSIRRTQPDGTEYWSARELMPFLGYVKWQKMEEVIARAQSSCLNAGHNPTEHITSVASIFTGSGKNSKSAGRPGLDVSLSRYACYLVAMNGDPRKVEIAAAQQYFALKTREAEIAAQQSKMPISKSWGDRFKATTQAHFCYVSVNHPGYWSVVSATVTQVLIMEDILLDHCLPVQPGDLPDGSIGKNWANYRRSLGREPTTLHAPLLLPSRGIDVQVAIYPDAELGVFRSWFTGSYLPVHLPAYFDCKPSFKPYGKLPPASAADRTCRGLTGQPASLAPRVRRQLTEAGGFVAAGSRPPAIEYQQKRLFD
jgi:hypothetical protein